MKRSAGLLLWRRRTGLEVLLAHPGGPLHAHKDVWGIPKGLVEPGEDLMTTAYREFGEEIGLPAPAGDPVPLGEVVQRGGKVVTAWAIEGDLDVTRMQPGLFTMLWRGRLQQFPEIDRAEWFAVAAARAKMLPAQVPFLNRLEELCESPPLR
jgi:predicted NUDIX family NTP pyrophosphohydrolase